MYKNPSSLSLYVLYTSPMVLSPTKLYFPFAAKNNASYSGNFINFLIIRRNLFTVKSFLIKCLVFLIPSN